jgi:hypothetical protein
VWAGGLGGLSPAAAHRERNADMCQHISESRLKPQPVRLPLRQVTIALDAGLTWDMFPVVLAWRVAAPQSSPASSCLLPCATESHAHITLWSSQGLTDRCAVHLCRCAGARTLLLTLGMWSSSKVRV